MHTGKPAVKFSCVHGCSDCCVYREYYPSMEFGKIGVLILPEEKDRIEKLAAEKGISLRIIPRLAVGAQSPEHVIAYQMMGKNQDGDLCPFLAIDELAPHGGLKCRIYSERPLACRAYPVIDSDNKQATLDPHCQFCSKFSTVTADAGGLQQELESLSRIKARVKAERGSHVWRYATATGAEKDRKAMLPEGWVLES